jgi:5-methylcytosine-specific restriction endonuclease McrA
MADEIITRAEAVAQGLKRFFIGVPCRQGHIAERGVSHGKCLRCLTENSKRWGELHPERRAEQMARIRAKRKSKLKAYHRRWYEANGDNKRAKNKAYRLAHPEAGRAYALRWRNKNIEKARANARKWHSDPENGRAHDQKRRALKRNASGSHTAADLAAILKAQAHRCAYCRSDLRRAKRHVDHIQPLARSGSNDRANLQYLCAPCNLAKGARDPVEFAQELGRLL